MKRVNIAVLSVLFVLSASTAFAQRTRSRTGSASRPKATAPTPKAATPAQPEPAKEPERPAPVKTGKIELEAGLIFNSGDVKPVGRATFSVLKESAEKIVLTQEHLDMYNRDISSLGFGSQEKSLAGWSMYGAVLYMDGQITPSYAAAVRDAISKASVASATTGFDGKATIEDVPIGDYYLFGVYKFGKQTTYWNVPVSVKAGTNRPLAKVWCDVNINR
jgi:hypothetical protein